MCGAVDSAHYFRLSLFIPPEAVMLALSGYPL